MGQHFYQQRSNVSDHKGLNLEPYIQFDKERITPKRVVFHSIRFNLDKDSLKDIQQAQQTGDHLDISPSLLADLRYYALIDWENRLKSGLTFCTYYQRSSIQEALIRSVIFLDGEILHQIKGDCLEQPNFCHQIASAHYWLIEQLLRQLHLRVLLRLALLSWGLSLLIVAVTVVPFVPQLIAVSPWLLLVPVVVLLLVQLVVQHLLRLFAPAIRRWALRQLLSGLLSRQPLEQKIAQGILVWLVP